MVDPTTALAERLRAAGCVFAEQEAALLLAAGRLPDEVERLVAQRLSGLPLEVVLGWAEFCGRRIVVEPGVFVPRRRTALLVRTAVRSGAPPRPVVVDLCCGTGAVGVAVAGEVDAGRLHAADVDPAAVACARRNVEPVGGRVHEGDLYAALPSDLRGRVDLLLVNAPYVPTRALALLPPEARLHEPAVALDGGADGLDVQRRVAADAAGWLAPSGRVLLETSDEQADRTLALLAGAGLVADVVRDDELAATVAVARRA